MNKEEKMKKSILILSTLLITGSLSQPAYTGLLSSFKDLLGKSLKPEDAAKRLEALLKAEEEMTKLSGFYETATAKTKDINEGRKKLFEENKGELTRIRQAIASNIASIQEMAAEELRKLQIEKEKNTTDLKGINDGLSMWTGLKAASALMANAESNFGQIMGYANNLSGNSKEDMEDKKEALLIEMKRIESKMLDLRAIKAAPNMTLITSSEGINEAFRRLSKLQEDLNKATSILERILAVPEKSLQTYAELSDASLKGTQRSLETLVAAAQCPDVKAWTQAVKINASGRYEPSEKFQACKWNYVEVAKKSTKSACQSLSVTSQNQAIQKCVDSY